MILMFDASDHRSCPIGSYGAQYDSEAESGRYSSSRASGVSEYEQASFCGPERYSDSWCSMTASGDEDNNRSANGSGLR